MCVWVCGCGCACMRFCGERWWRIVLYSYTDEAGEEEKTRDGPVREITVAQEHMWRAAKRSLRRRIVGAMQLRKIGRRILRSGLRTISRVELGAGLTGGTIPKGGMLIMRLNSHGYTIAGASGTKAMSDCLGLAHKSELRRVRPASAFGARAELHGVDKTWARHGYSWRSAQCSKSVKEMVRRVRAPSATKTPRLRTPYSSEPTAWWSASPCRVVMYSAIRKHYCYIDTSHSNGRLDLACQLGRTMEK